jgi:hypothetical protein
MIERLFVLVKCEPSAEPTKPSGVAPPNVSEIVLGRTQQNQRVRRLHGHMKRDNSSLVVATLRTGFLVGFAVILILVLFPAIAAQAAGPR